MTLTPRLERALTSLRAAASADGVVEGRAPDLAARLALGSERNFRSLVGALHAAGLISRSESSGKGRGYVTRLVVKAEESRQEGGKKAEESRQALAPAAVPSSPRPESLQNSYPSSPSEEGRTEEPPAEGLKKAAESRQEGGSPPTFADEAIADRVLGILELLADLLAERVRSKLDGAGSNGPNVNSVGAVAAAPAPAGPTATSSPRTSSSGETRPPTKPRAAAPLWGCETAERTEALDRARKILAAELRAGESVGAKLEDVRRYPLEDVLRAVAHVELAVARGKPLRSRAASFWSALTDPTYKLEEGAVANRDAVAETLERAQVVAPQPAPAKVASVAAAPPQFDPERQRRIRLQAVYEKLPKADRASLDAEAEALARSELGQSAPDHRVSLLKVDKRQELLESRLHARAQVVTGP